MEERPSSDERPAEEPVREHAAEPWRWLVELEPLARETAPPVLASALTPCEEHFVRDHFGEPTIDPVRHDILVEGAVSTPTAVPARALEGMPWRTVTVTLECAGNGRAELQPLPEGEPWERGAVGTAAWSGVSLGELLRAVGLRDDVCEVLVVGADVGSVSGDGAGDGGEHPYARSLPIEKALDPDTLLALAMNGRPIPREHGAPVRLVVPGWYGMASVKWVCRVIALVQPFVGYFQRHRYVYVGADGQAREPVTTVRVKSLITAPSPGAVVPRGKLLVEGWAWSSGVAIAGVEVALDGGDHWQEARLEPGASPYAWTRFAVEIDVPRPGRHAVRARARDTAGRIQPYTPTWNHYGYGNNAVAPVFFHVV